MVKSHQLPSEEGGGRYEGGIKSVPTYRPWHEQPGLGKPSLSEQEAIEVVSKYYTMTVESVRHCEELDSERDQNFYIKGRNALQYVLKVSNVEEDIGILEMQHSCWKKLHSEEVEGVPIAVPNDSGSLIISYKSSSNESSTLLCRVTRYIEGKPIAALKGKLPDDIWSKVGKYVGRISQSMLEFKHLSSSRHIIWDIKNAEDVVSEYIDYVQDEANLALLRRFMERMKRLSNAFSAERKGLRVGVIHGDCNDHNLIVGSYDMEISLIDYGDMVKSYMVNELSVAAAYASMYPNRMQNVEDLAVSYNELFPLRPNEILFFLPFLCMRLCTSCVVSSRNLQLNPGNPYLQISSEDAWSALRFFDKLDARDIVRSLERIFRDKVPNEEEFCHCWSLLENGVVDEMDKEFEFLKSLRSQYLGRNLSLLYEKPIHLVRGAGCFLFDKKGNRYLDAVNNVPHVGHSNEVVADAVSKAMNTLNTNSRYIRSDIISYAKQLIDTLPDPLKVVYFCNSGSEANDLALRIARETCSHGGRDVVAMNGAYHGHTASCIEISPYKFNSKGGKGKPESTHIMPLPDTLRGIHVNGKEEACKLIKRARSLDRKICAFISESLLSCGGQVILPEGYLAQVYEQMKGIGAVCIADEVQCGFGRVGSHFWGFQTQNVVPDIVVLGKSIGNGFPLSAVVTTEKLADAFAKGVEYFNTFGGCNAACAAGLSVMKVIKEDGLQLNSKIVGAYLLDLLKEVTKGKSFIAETRGKGLFIGIEFVVDQVGMGPAPNMAKYICNRMKERMILVSTDGMHSSVIKIKPPLIFDKENAKHLADTLELVLSNDLDEQKISSLLDADRKYNMSLNTTKNVVPGLSVALASTFHSVLQQKGNWNYWNTCLLCSTNIISVAVTALVLRQYTLGRQ